MTQKQTKLKPSFLEAGLPCSSLSSECQSDNDARQRPPQNRLHVWWARRPPTICRVAILTALLPHDDDLNHDSLAAFDPPVRPEDLQAVTGKERQHLDFYRRLLEDIPPTPLPDRHRRLLLALRAFGDPVRFDRHREEARANEIPLPKVFSQYLSHNRDQSIPVGLLAHLRKVWKGMFGLANGEVPVLLDSMAGGGAIPLEGVRYGLRVFANELNPVAALVLKATIEYPARFSNSLTPHIIEEANIIAERLRSRLARYFPLPPASEWWPAVEQAARAKFSARSIARIEPDTSREPRKNTYLWVRVFPCKGCGLRVPLSTNFILDTKGKPPTHLAAFPVVPGRGGSDECSFQIVGRAEWEKCTWPRPGFEKWDPKETPTFRDGKVICPRCGRVEEGDMVKEFARSQTGGLDAQLYAVACQVPLCLVYNNGEVKVRFLWWFRSPNSADLRASRAAEKEYQRLGPTWESRGLTPTTEVPEVMEDRRPREYGMSRWCDLFRPRQLLTNLTVLEEIRNAGKRLVEKLPKATAEAAGVYLGFILSKLVNYNSVNTFWHYGRRTATQTFSRHDFAFRPAFCEFEGAREPIPWGLSQVTGALTELAGVIHGSRVAVEGNEDSDPEEEEDGAGDQSATTLPMIPQRPEIIVPTVTCDDAAALETPAPGTVHLICVDPPYYSNVQYSELSNFFYVWLKRALHDWPGLEHLFREELAETNREAVANAARWKGEAEADEKTWHVRYEQELAALKDKRDANGKKLKKADRELLAAEQAGPRPLTAADRAERFYEDKMAAIFRRARQLLHPTGRMVVMFNHKMTKAWRALGAALIREGFEIRTSVPIHTEAESSLNIRGLDAARSTVLLLCLPREEAGQVTGNWGRVQSRVAAAARDAAKHFQGQGLSGTDLYLSALGPALREVGRHWPITDMAGRPIDLGVALDEAYRAVGRFRLEQILAELTGVAAFADVSDGFTADSVDKNTQSLWLWLDTFQGDVAHSDDVRKLAKSLDIEPDGFKRLRLLEVDSDNFILKPPQEVNLGLLARNLTTGESRTSREREARAADVWDERKFPGFLGAAVWNAVGLMAGGEETHRGVDALRQWLRHAGYGDDRYFRGAFAVTLHLLRRAFGRRREGDPWHEATAQAGAAWDLVLQSWRG
jgi:adenine-specific DNA methylase